MKKLFITLAILLILGTAQSSQRTSETEEKLGTTENQGGFFSQLTSIFEETKKKIENIPETVTKFGSGVGKRAKALPGILSREISEVGQIGDKIKKFPNLVSKKVNAIGSQAKSLFGKIQGVFDSKESENDYNMDITKESVENSNEEIEKKEIQVLNQDFTKQEDEKKEEVKNDQVHTKEIKENLQEVPENTVLKNESNEKNTEEPKGVKVLDHIEAPGNTTQSIFATLSGTFSQIQNFSGKIISKIKICNNGTLSNIPKQISHAFQSVKNKFTNLMPNITSSRFTSLKKKLNETSNSVLGGFSAVGRKIKNLSNSFGQSLTQGTFKDQIKSLPSKLLNSLSNLPQKMSPNNLLKVSNNTSQKMKLKFKQATNFLTEEWRRLFSLFFSNQTLNTVESFFKQSSQKFSEQFYKFRLKLNIANFLQVFNAIGSNIMKLPEKFNKVFGSMFDLWKTIFTNMFSKFINILGSVSQGAWNIIKGGFDFIETNFIPFFKSAWNIIGEIGGFFGNIFTGFSGWIKSWLWIITIILVLLVFLHFMPTALSIIQILFTILGNLVSAIFGIMSIFKGTFSLAVWISNFTKKNKKDIEKKKEKKKPRVNKERNEKKSPKKIQYPPGGQRFYGYFKCSECNGQWESRNTFEDFPQECKKCGTKVFPYCQIKLLDPTEKTEKLKEQHKNDVLLENDNFSIKSNIEKKND